jgi:heme exporter protein D
VLDWITVVIELVGVAILIAWIVIPIREFRQILRAIKDKERRQSGASGSRTRE